MRILVRAGRRVLHEARRVVAFARRARRRPWARLYPFLMSEAALLRATGHETADGLWGEVLARPFFFSHRDREEWAAAFRAAYPDAVPVVVEAAERVLRHEHDLLGSGLRCLGWPLPWHEDFKTGRRWPLRHAPDIPYLELDRPSDVKVPWELSRCQHFTTLGQAYWLTGDERFAREIVAQVDDWTRQNPWGFGVNWICAMDVALRAVSWTWALHYLGDSPSCPTGFRARFLRALYMHGEFLASHHPRHQVNGNHFLCEAVGLVFLGNLFARHAAGRRWLDLGAADVVAELQLQVRADGVDFEQSTAYQRLVLEAFVTSWLLLRRLDRSPPPEGWAQLARMFEYVAAYTRPDGLAPLIGDADDGRVQKLGGQPIGDHRYLLSTAAVLFDRSDFKAAAGRFWEESFWLGGPQAMAAFAGLRDEPGAGPLAAASRAFPDGGFFVLRSRDVHVVVDCGEVGLAGRGGHGHNDALGFELWTSGGPVVSDCGAFLYSASREWRNRFRSTAFHNVVQVDDEEINRFTSPDQLWSLRYDAVPTPVTFRPGPDVDYFRGGHRGYERLATPVVVWREIALLKQRGEVVIRDSLAGTGTHEITSRFHLDPTARPSLQGGHEVHLELDHGEIWLQPIAGGLDLVASLQPGWVSPSYGVKVATQVVVLTGKVSAPFQMTYVFAPRALSAAERERALCALERAAGAPDPADD